MMLPEGAEVECPRKASGPMLPPLGIANATASKDKIEPQPPAREKQSVSEYENREPTNNNVFEATNLYQRRRCD
jgi:hypothetical protein